MVKIICLLATFFVFLAIIAAEMFSKTCPKVAFGVDPVEAVNILSGTDSRYDLSHGSSLPLITRPWGFNGFAPQTDNDPTWPGWWFHPSDRRYFGLRLTHQPSPWISDYGNFLIKAYMPSNPASNSGSGDTFVGYLPKTTVYSPHYFSTSLLMYGNSNGNMLVEFTPAMHGGIMRVTYPGYIAQEVGDSAGTTANQRRRISIVLPLSTDHTEVGKSPVDGTITISGYTTKNSGGVGSSEAAFAHYFVAAIYAGTDGSTITTTSISTVSGGQTAWVDFDPLDSQYDVLTVRIATSFISQEQAWINFQHEVLKVPFDTLKEDAKAEWNSVLSRIQIAEPAQGLDDCETAANLYSIFYTTLYRASLFPRLLTEYDSNNNAIHWSPYATRVDTRVMNGHLSTDSGFWDAWNTVYGLLSLYHRPQLGTTMTGWLNAYKEGGWLPKWASPGYRGSMIGTMGDVSVAAAIVNNIPNMDIALAYEAIRKDAFEIPPVGVDGVGRVCLSSYLTYGYVPRDAPATTGGTCYEVVSRSLNYLQSDYAIAQAALKMGKQADYDVLALRIQNASKIFDASTGFFRSKQIATEKWTEPFDQFAWGGDYTEGGPWQYRFYLPHDLNTLSSLYSNSGRDMCEELNKAMTMEHSTFHLGGYGEEIHEMTEMAANCYGQYAHNNQPSHYMLYTHFYQGYGGACADQGRANIRKTLLELYSNSADMFPGDEDNGEMAAWFVLSSMGLYEASPGSGVMTFGIPLFGKVTIDISDATHARTAAEAKQQKKKLKQQQTLTISAKNLSKDNIHIKRITWNGGEIPSTQSGIAYSSLMQGGKLVFEMGPALNKK